MLAEIAPALAFAAVSAYAPRRPRENCGRVSVAADVSPRTGRAVIRKEVQMASSLFHHPETSVEARNADAIRRLFDAVERRDRAGVIAAYGSDIVIHEAASLPYGGDYRGHEGALRHGQGFRAAWDRFQTQNARGLEPRIIAEGDHIVVLWRHKAENTDTGERIDLPAVSVYRMRERKIVDSRMFHFDTAALVEFLRCNSQ